MEILGKLIKLRTYKISDYESIRLLRKGDKEWKLLDSPNSPRKTDFEIDTELDKAISEHPSLNTSIPSSLVIANVGDDCVLGEVSRYNFNEVSNAVGIGLVIYNSEDWKQGIGTEVIFLWEKFLLEKLSETKKFIIETWSGNIGMTKIAKKFNYTLFEKRPNSINLNQHSYSKLLYEKSGLTTK